MNHRRPTFSTTTHTMLFLWQMFAEEQYVKTRKSVYFYLSPRIAMIRAHVLTQRISINTAHLSRLTQLADWILKSTLYKVIQDTPPPLKWNPRVLHRDKQVQGRGWNDCCLGTHQSSICFLLNFSLKLSCNGGNASKHIIFERFLI